MASIAIGKNSSATGNYSFAIGKNSSVNYKNSVRANRVKKIIKIFNLEL